MEMELHKGALFNEDSPIEESKGMSKLLVLSGLFGFWNSVQNSSCGKFENFYQKLI